MSMLVDWLLSSFTLPHAPQGNRTFSLVLSLYARRVRTYAIPSLGFACPRPLPLVSSPPIRDRGSHSLYRCREDIYYE